MLAFDDDTSALLAAGARELHDALRGQTASRQQAVDEALHDAAGPHRDLLGQAARTEAVDRTELARRIEALSRQIDRVRAAAEQERRRRAVAAAREAVLMPPDHRPGGAPSAGPTGAALAVRPISASFSARERRRAGGAFGARSSADPARLRRFAERTRWSDRRLHDLLDEVETVWRRFLAHCSWAPVGEVTVFAGARALLEENRADAEWMERVAAAFESAGGGSLTSTALRLVSGPPLQLSEPRLLEALPALGPGELDALRAAHPGLHDRLLGLSAPDVNRWWRALGDGPDGFSAHQRALLEAFPELLGTLEGVPYRARDRANRSALTTRIDALTAERDAAVLAAGDVRARPSASGLEIAAATARVAQADERLRPLLAVRRSLVPVSVSVSSRRLLVSLTSGEPPLAAVSIGDPDTAETVVYTVPGMGTTATDLPAWTRASQNAAELLPARSAVIAWIGYETPPVPDAPGFDLSVLDNRHAETGGAALAASLRGLAAVRQEDPVVPDVIAHSYGTTTTAFALLEDDVEVDAFVALGSAGLPPAAATASALHARAVYSGQARPRLLWEKESGDEAAWMGRSPLSFSQSSRGARAFGVETGGSAGRVVTDHSALKSDDGPRAGYFDVSTEAMRNAARAVLGRESGITENRPLGPTEYQDALRRGLTRAP
jgi:hypothetical protein